LIRAPLSTTSVLDESADAVRVTGAAWAALLILTSLPYRFAQAIFIDRLLELGGEATHYGNLLGSLARWTMGAFVISRCGRAIYARACRLATDSGEAPGAIAWRVPLAALANYLFLSAIVESITWLSLMTCLAFPLCVLLSGFAIGTMEMNEQPSIVMPFRLLAKRTRELRYAAALVLIFACALVVATINVAFAAGIGLALAEASGRVDVPRWTVLLHPDNHRFIAMIIAGGVLAIEPFWIAANVILVRKGGAVESGEELRVWFEELRRA